MRRLAPLALALLAGCPWVGDGEWTARQDWDGDGFVSYTFGGADCDDGDPAVFPGAAEVWYDGIDQDCDGSAEFDLDGDGYVGIASDGVAIDCDDADPQVFPGAAEACNGVDDDCDGAIPDDEVDADGDGWRICDGDCDDTEPAISPGAAEVCDARGLDEDCDGDSNDGDSDVTGAAAWYLDADGDGFGDESTELLACLAPIGAVAAASGGVAFDCDDTDPGVAPGMDEGCDGIDTDCDGALSPDETEDADGDGFPLCEDCDDADGRVWPGAPELCDDRRTDCASVWVGDDGLLSFQSADDVWTALDPGAPNARVSHTLAEDGTVHVCEGTHNVSLIPQAEIAVVGLGGAARSVLAGAEGSPALDIQGAVTVTVSGVTLTENGLRCVGPAAVLMSEARIADSDGLYGGGFALRDGCAAELSAVTLSNNQASYGGGGYLDAASSLTCSGCDFGFNAPDDIDKAGVSYTWDAAGLDFHCGADSAVCE